MAAAGSPRGKRGGEGVRGDLQGHVDVNVADLGQEGAAVPHDAGHPDGARPGVHRGAEARPPPVHRHRQAGQHIPAPAPAPPPPSTAPPSHPLAAAMHDARSAADARRPVDRPCGRLLMAVLGTLTGRPRAPRFPKAGSASFRQSLPTPDTALLDSAPLAGTNRLGSSGPLSSRGPVRSPTPFGP